MVKLKETGSTQKDIAGLFTKASTTKLHELGYWKVAVIDVHPFWVQLVHKRKFMLDLQFKHEYSTEQDVIDMATWILKRFSNGEMMAITVIQTPEYSYKFHRYDT